MPVKEPEVALTVTVPGAFAVSTPPGEMLAVGLGLGVVPHRTAAGQAVATTLLSLHSALNCRVSPTDRNTVAGVTDMDVATVDETVTDAVPTREPEVAVTVTVPAAFAVSRPDGEMLAVGLGLGVVPHTMAAGQGVAMTLLSRHPAVNCRVWPGLRAALAGVITTAVATEGRTWRASEVVSPKSEAEIVTVPGDTPTTSPSGLTVAMSGSSLDQVIRDSWSTGQFTPAALSVSGVTITLCPT